MRGIKKRIWVLAVLLCLVSCGENEVEENRLVSMNLLEETILQRDNTNKLQGGELEIRLAKVIVDARCPMHVVCVWEGNVEIDFEIVERGRLKKIHFEYREGNVAAYNTIVLEGYRIKIKSILPYPDMLEPSSMVNKEKKIVYFVEKI